MKFARGDTVVLVLALDLPLTLPRPLQAKRKSGKFPLKTELTPSALNSVFWTTLMALKCGQN